MNYYEILGVSESATPDEIKKAYRKLASQHHPDRGGDTAKFQDIQAAYDTLSDVNRRAQYDAQRQGAGVHFNFHGHPGSHPDLDEIFQQFGFQFGGDPFANFRQHAQKPRRNKDLRISVTIPLANTLTNQKKLINIQTTKGTAENVEVEFPRGIHDGSVIKYPGLGDNFFDSLPRGDLLIHVSVLPDARFSVQGLDLVTELPLDCLTAITGGEIIVTGIDGSEFAISVPAGTQNGTGFRITGQGLWQINHSTRGNLIVKIIITVPTDLTPEQVDMVRRIRTTL